VRPGSVFKNAASAAFLQLPAQGYRDSLTCDNMPCAQFNSAKPKKNSEKSTRSILTIKHIGQSRAQFPA
jgi:hypothetical protein